MALSKQLQDRIEAVAADLRKELYGPKGYPPWGTKFVEIEDEEESPRWKVADALRYLQNKQSRMHYDVYRRLGLPLTSSHIESTIKQINRRVKGTEKFWSQPTSEAVLQLRADYLSDSAPLDSFWLRHQARQTGVNAYAQAP